MPKAKEGFGSAFGRSLNPNSAAKLKFKTDFQTMKLYCGTRKCCRSILAGFRDGVRPKPGGKDGRFHLQRYLHVFTGRRKSRMRSGEAGNLFLEGRRAHGQDFDEKTVQHVWADFDAFRRAQTASAQAASAAKP